MDNGRKIDFLSNYSEASYTFSRTISLGRKVRIDVSDEHIAFRRPLTCASARAVDFLYTLRREALLFLRDVKSLIADQERRLLHVSLFAYILLLPFHLALSIRLPTIGHVVRYTEIAFVFVAFFGVQAWIRGHITLRRSYWLYGFLALQAAAQFMSIANAPFRTSFVAMGTSIAIYSIVVFILVNVIDSEKLLRVVLGFMGISLFVVVINSLYLFVANDWVFQTRDHSSIVGSRIGNYLAYFLVMYGAGLLFLFFREKVRLTRFLVLLAITAWMYVVILSGVKAASIAVLLFFLVLFFLLRGSRLAVASLVTLFLALFFMQINFLTVQEKIADARVVFVAQVGRVTAAGKRSIHIPRITIVSLKKSPRVEPAPPAPRVEPAPPAPPESAYSVSVSVRAVPVRIPSTGNFAFVAPPVFEKDHPVKFTPQLEAPRSLVEVENERARGLFEIRDSSELVEQNNVKLRWENSAALSSLGFRVRGVLAAWHMGLAFPLTGVGAGQSSLFFDHFSEVVREKGYNPAYLSFLPQFVRQYVVSNTKFTMAKTNPHNLFMIIWAETGIIGLVALLGIFAVIIVQSVRALWPSRLSVERRAIQFLFPSFIALTFIQMFSFLYVHPWFWTTVALWYVAAVIARETNTITHASMV